MVLKRRLFSCAGWRSVAPPPRADGKGIGVRGGDLARAATCPTSVGRARRRAPAAARASGPATWPGCRPGPVNSTGTARPTQRTVEGGLLLAQQRLDLLQPRGPSRPPAPEAGAPAAGVPGRGEYLKRVGLGEADLADQRQRRLVVGLRLAGMAGDEVGGQREVRPRRAQPVDDAQVVGRRVAAVHRRQHAVGAGLHRQVQEGHQLRACRDARRSASSSMSRGWQVV